jgi:hypothetical protein
MIKMVMLEIILDHNSVTIMNVQIAVQNLFDIIKMVFINMI